MNQRTIKLTKARLIGSHHLPVGTVITLDEKRANALIKDAAAVPQMFDETKLPPAPAKRRMVETASTSPGPKKAARIVGKAE